jgi:hypothetical protein
MFNEGPESERIDGQPRAIHHQIRLFARRNRGILLDIVMFVANLYMMRMLSGYFLTIFRSADETNAGTMIPLGICCVAMLFLPAIGAVLKRWHYHQRMAAQGGLDKTGRGVLWGCLCNPIFYFCLNLVVMSAIMTIGIQVLFGNDLDQNGGAFVGSLLLGMVITGVQTFLVYRYFSPPKNPPQSAFLRSRVSETLGDAAVYLNMALFQAAWNIITFMDLEPVADFTDFAGRLFFLSFVALLIYFPPRIFYLAEDINRPTAWLTMVLANAPVILRVLSGWGSGGW